MYKLLKMKLGQQNACPFPHKETKSGKVYYEKEPSSGLDEKGKFNCFVCGRGYTDEAWFTSAYMNISYKQAEKFLKMLENSRLFIPSLKKWKTHQDRLKEELQNKDSKYYKYLEETNLLDILDEARLGLYQDYITYPYVYKGAIMNLTQFCPGEVPKYRNSRGTLSGIIGTTRKFNPNKDYVIIAAGEKDMLILNKFDFNAVTILGGEKAKPYYFKNIFRDKKVYIAYDNDKAGKEGAEELAKWLYRYTRTIKVLNIDGSFNQTEDTLTDIISEDKEDIENFFNKYQKTDIDLNNIIENTNWYQPPALEDKSVLDLINDVRKLMTQLSKTILEKEKKND